MLELRTIDVRTPMSKTQAMYIVRPECGGKALTRPDVSDCYASVIISEFLSQCPMRLTHRTQIKSFADVFRLLLNKNQIPHQLHNSLRINQTLHPLLPSLHLFHHQIEMTTLSYLPITLIFTDQTQLSNYKWHYHNLNW